MAETNTPKKSNLVRYFLIPFFVILIAQIIGRSAAGGEVEQQFLFEAIIRAAIPSAIYYGIMWMVRSRRRGNDK